MLTGGMQPDPTLGLAEGRQAGRNRPLHSHTCHGCLGVTLLPEPQLHVQGALGHALGYAIRGQRKGKQGVRPEGPGVLGA